MKSRKTRVLIVVLVLAAAAAAGFLAARLSGQSAPPAETNGPEDNRNTPDTPSPAAEDADWGSTVIYDGVRYRFNPDLTTVLFLGIDDAQDGAPDGNVGTGGRADALLLFILDDAEQTTTALAISRDTMTEVDVYKTNGDYAYSGLMHINMQYAYGDSPRRSCYLQKRTVSRLLYGMQIDGCISLTMEGIARITEAMGGVTLTMPEDYTDIDGRYTAGAEITLTGPEMERFVRYRDVEETGSNDVRMERQAWLLGEVFRQMKEKGGLRYVSTLLEQAADCICSDLDAETMKHLADYTLADGTRNVPGATAEGERHDEFIVDEEALRALLIELFYIPAA